MNNNSLNPVRTFGGLMEELFNGKTPRFFQDDFFNEEWSKNHGHIPVNISENKDAYHMEVIAPGLKKEDFKVALNDNILNISFEHREEKKEEAPSVIRQEFKRHSFKRSFKLGETVAAEKINARYENGILFLEIPKKEEVKAANKVIEIA